MSSRTSFACASALLLLCLGWGASAQSGRVQTPATTPQQTPPAATPPTPATGDKESPAPDDEVESVDVDLASILLTVVDRQRRFVNTLRQEDVRVTEDGVPQTVSVFQRETDLPLSIALLVDTSGSQEGVMEDEKRAARAFLDSVLRPEKDAAAVLSFTGVMRLEQLPTSDPSALHAAVERVKVLHSSDSPECNEDNRDVPEEQVLRCKTAVWDAIYLAVEHVLAKTPLRTRRAIILLSDGDDTVSRTGRDAAADFAVRHNTVIYSIGIRDRKFPHGDLRRSDLRKVAERTGGRAFFPRDPAELQSAFAQIDSELRSQYYIAYTPTNRQRDGRFRRVRVEITNPALKKEKLRLLYREGYYARSGG